MTTGGFAFFFLAAAWAWTEAPAVAGTMRAPRAATKAARRRYGRMRARRVHTSPVSADSRSGLSAQPTVVSAFDGSAQDVAPVRGHDDEILDPHPAAARHVHARLDGHHVAGLEHVVARARQPRRLVDLEPDAVAEPVAEVVPVPLGGDQVARHGVDLAARRAGPHGVERRLLGAQDEVVDLRQVVVELAGGPRARAVRAVAVEPRPEVEGHEHAGGDLDVARLGVRQRAVLGRGHDRREAGVAGAAAAHLLLERARHLALGAPDDAALAHPVVDVVRERRGGADRLDLLRLLERPLGLDRAARGHELDAVGEQLAQALVLAHAHVLVLEAEPHAALRPAAS